MRTNSNPFKQNLPSFMGLIFASDAAEAQRKVQQTTTEALWDKVRAGSDEINNDPTTLDSRPLHEKLKENQEKAAALREEQLHGAVFQAPRVYNDEEMRFLADQEASQRMKELEIQQQLSEFDALAEQHRQHNKISESESTLKIITSKRTASSSSISMFRNSAPKKRINPDADHDGLGTPTKKAKAQESSCDDETADASDNSSLASLIGY